MAHFGLDAYVPEIAGATFDTSRSKKGQVIAYALETFGIDPATAVMVGDREQHRVSALGGMSRATASAVVKTLVRSGYVVQVPSEVDKRTHLLALTETGQEVVREVFVEQNDLLTDWSNRLTHTEQDILKMLLTKLMGDSS